MRLISWNVNGIRALHRKGCWQDILALNPDLLLLQETKALPDQMPEEIQHPQGYHVFFSNHNKKKGYSGTALFSKEQPASISYGIGVPRFDNEGRIIEAQFCDLVVLNVYFPNGGMGPERLAYKLDFYDAFLEHLILLKKEGKKIIFGGDVNTAHEEIDLARPKENEENTGFLPEERAWIDTIIAAGFTDSFRHLFPSKRNAYTYWDMKTFARSRNVGWRLDYFFVSNDLLPSVEQADIHSTIQGSDHCPISLTCAGTIS